MSDTHACRPVLIIEDDADIRESLQDALEAEKYRVITAVDGWDGLQRLKEMNEPCIILLDLMMPVMSGGEFLVALRASEMLASIPVVVVSAWPDEAAKVRHQTQGYVKKPIALNALLEAVFQFCREHAARDALAPKA
jgi:DNA-binding response OmpR family regulator